MSPISGLITQSLSQVSLNGTSPADGGLMVICAWPLSGQYGLGTRIIYYGAVVGCVLFRKMEWLRSSLLGDVVMLFPVVAALHSIVLAAVHVDGATDLDIYGAFQLMVLGVLSAPFTIKTSRTYFNDPGRNIVFLWTVMLVAGLLSLVVEFYRMNPSKCDPDDSGIKSSLDASNFPYETAPTCGLTCSIAQGPYSPLRQGSANNIYVIPAPDKLTVGTAMLVAAACCIPSIISVGRMWSSILESSWKRRFGDGVHQRTNTILLSLIRVIQIPVFLAVFLAVLVVSERNFASPQMSYQTEPFASIGQWFPCVGAGILLLVAMYLLLVAHPEPDGGDVTVPVTTQSSGEPRYSRTDSGRNQPEDWVRLPRTPRDTAAPVGVEMHTGTVASGHGIPGDPKPAEIRHLRHPFPPRAVASRQASFGAEVQESFRPCRTSRQRASSL